ncbi:hypothetical protein CK203_069029 [Vitis vinifera]|uniref:Uncharacterized protein n=1 Tax=Vitis vinifera TaxID=29760 RepID=A0A438F0S0_VITVI|nr:hypothetical protein CK203_069029 [Vitis vinifera]
MEEAKTMKTPMSSSIKLDKDEKGKSIDSTMYRGVIGESQLPIGYRASAQLSRLSRRLAERVTYGMGGPIISTVRGIKICLDLKSICRIFDIALVGLRIGFLTRVFKDVGVDLSKETDFEALSTYDTDDDQSMGRMKFEKAPDGS